jgi:hypothetical protein
MISIIATVGGAEEVEGANLVDEFGTKLARLVDEVKHASAKGEKCVVFSAWSRLLHLAGGALADQNIAFSSLAGSLEERKVALLRFRGNDSSKTISSATIVGVESSGVATDPKVLLVPLFGGSSGAGGGGAAGLTLTEANVAILLEPALQPGCAHEIKFLKPHESCTKIACMCTGSRRRRLGGYTGLVRNKRHVCCACWSKIQSSNRS